MGFRKRVHEIIVPKEGYDIGVLKHPEFVPLEDIKSLRKKWKNYLDIEQDRMHAITLGIFIKKTKSNIIKFIKYFVKMILNAIFKPGIGMPIKYEFYNALYHLQIIYRLFINLIRNIFHKSS
jgi:hypothetical protein